MAPPFLATNLQKQFRFSLNFIPQLYVAFVKRKKITIPTYATFYVFFCNYITKTDSAYRDNNYLSIAM